MSSISDDIFFAGIAEINRKLTKKEFSAVELARAFCERLDSIGPRYNALALSLRKDAVRDAKDVDGDIKRDRFAVLCKAFPLAPRICSRTRNIPPLGARSPTRIRFSITPPPCSKYSRSTAVC